MNWDPAIKHLLKWEGGYVNDPRDLGGETKYGITKRRYPNLDIKRLTKAQAIAIYRRDFYDALRIEMLPEHLRYLVFDGAVNQGPAWSIRALQRLAGVRADGVIGPVTAKAAKKVTLMAYADERRKRYEYIAGFRQNRVFLRGWLRRLESAVAFATAQLGKPAVTANAELEIEDISEEPCQVRCPKCTTCKR